MPRSTPMNGWSRTAAVLLTLVALVAGATATVVAQRAQVQQNSADIEDIKSELARLRRIELLVVAIAVKNGIKVSEPLPAADNRWP